MTLHRTRLGFVEERTALYNRLRGLIAEFGIVLPQKVERLRAEIGAHLEHLMELLAIPLSTIKPCKWLVMPALM